MKNTDGAISLNINVGLSRFLEVFGNKVYVMLDWTRISCTVTNYIEFFERIGRTLVFAHDRRWHFYEDNDCHHGAKQ